MSKAKQKPQRTVGAARLKAMLERNRAARDPNDERNHDVRLSKLRNWQAERLARDYADLQKISHFKPACNFFLNELYGDSDFAQRDQDVERIYPIMVKLLPAQVLGTVSRAVELNALSHELDLAMVEHLPSGNLSAADYRRAYRAANNSEQRRNQLALILSLGRELARVVQIPLMFKLLQMCKWPARMAGLGALQGFLERGFAAFVELRGAGPFLQTIRNREVAFLQKQLSD
jgi:hypothetical protein